MEAVALRKYLFIHEPTEVIVEVVASGTKIAKESIADSIRNLKFTFPEGTWQCIGSDKLGDG